MKTAQEILATNLKAFRAKAGLTQLEAAEAIDIALRSYQKYEQRETFPDDKNLDKLARLFGVSVGELLSQGKPSTQAQVHATLQEAARMLTAMALASAPRRALILALIYRDESYLDALPREVGHAVRVLGKVP